MNDQAKPKPPPKGCIVAIMLLMAAVPVALVVGVFRLISWVSAPSPAGVMRAAEVPVSEMASAAPVAPQEKPAATGTDAWIYAQEFVKRGLKSPSIASFGSVFGESQSGTKCCKQQSDSSWRCNGWVDAQNAFGAMLRSDFSVTLKQTDDGAGWQLVAGPVIVSR